MRTYVFYWGGTPLKFAEDPKINNMMTFYKAETVGQALEMFRKDRSGDLARITCIQETEPRHHDEVHREIK